MREETNNKTSKNKIFTAKSQYQNLEAPSNKVKMQSVRTLTTRILFFFHVKGRGKF